MFLKKLSLTAILVGSVATISLAQKPTPTVDVADKGRKVKSELNVAYKRC
jgi:hypothetical protein